LNFPLVSKLLGIVMVILSLAFASCLGLAHLLDASEQVGSTRLAFALSLAISTGAAAGFFWIGRRHNRKFFRKEALCTIGLAWILASLIGSVPYLTALEDCTLADAIFESASGLTTTGASVFGDLESFPPSLMYWRCLSQWIGGMGVVVFFVAVLGFIGVGAKMLYANEASGSMSEFEESRIQSTVIKLVWVYLGLSSACALSYHLAGMSWFDAICHSFTTVSTAGFSTRSESLAAFGSPAIEWVAILFMAMAGLNFILILRLATGRFRFVSRNSEFAAYCCIMVVSCVLVSVFLRFDGTDWQTSHAIRAGAFQVVSIMTTTGYATKDFTQWASLPQMMLLCLMLIGGCSGSTSGGIKISRLIIAMRQSLLSIERSFRARVVRQIRLNGNTVSQQTLGETNSYLVLIACTLSFSILIVSVFETSHQIDTNLSVAFACLFNIGPGIAAAGPAENFGFLQAHTKVFLSLLMIMGRLELYAILALFSPSLWKSFS